MMTKEDYMHLPKERLAEMLVERDNQVCYPKQISISPVQIDYDSCPFGGKCLNKFKDCIGCPKSSTAFTTTSTDTIKKNDK